MVGTATNPPPLSSVRPPACQPEERREHAVPPAKCFLMAARCSTCPCVLVLLRDRRLSRLLVTIPAKPSPPTSVNRGASADKTFTQLVNIAPPRDMYACSFSDEQSAWPPEEPRDANSLTT